MSTKVAAKKTTTTVADESTKLTDTKPAESKPEVKKLTKKPAKAPVADKTPEPEVVVEVKAPETAATTESEGTHDESADADHESKPTKRMVVQKGEVSIRPVAKSPRKTSAKSPAKSPRSPRSPAKSPRAKSATKKTSKSPKTSPRAKSATKKPKAVAKTGGKRTAKKAKSAKTVVKARRPLNMKETQIDYMGIGIGPAKVKKVLTQVAFNPEEHAVRQALIDAENKPVRPKATAENPDPKEPEQGPQTPIEKLPKHILDVIRAAERVHLASLNEDYEKYVVSKVYDETKHTAYNEARKAAMKAAATADKEFNLREFNTSFDANFYKGFDAYCAENDSYLLSNKAKKSSKAAKAGDSEEASDKPRYNQWSRARALVNRMCTRLSSGVRDVLACFLDNFVVQYARNGIINCVEAGNSNLSLEHALLDNGSLEERVPLDAFARTFENYRYAQIWLEERRRVKEEIAAARKRLRANPEEGEINIKHPEYPHRDYDEKFDGYVVEICRSVRMQLADEQKLASDKNAYHNIKISEHFKSFCSYIIHEAIQRIGAHLKEVVALKEVKTVNSALMYYTLRQVCNICGIDFKPIKEDMETRLAKFHKWHEEHKRTKADKKATADAADDEEEEEDDDAAEADAGAADAEDVVPDDAEEEDAAEDAEDDGVEYEDE